MTFLIFLASMILFSPNINRYPLRNWDEAWYAEIVKNMALRNHGFLMPFWNGRYYLDHSPLYFWLSTVIVKIFGLGEWQVRLISAIAAATCVVLIYKIGTKLADKNAGIISAVIFITLGQVYSRFSQGNLDALMICLFLASFYSYLCITNKRQSVITGALIGLGMLVKSWGIGMFPIFLIFTHSLISTKKLPKNFIFLLTLIPVPLFFWYLPAASRYTHEFIEWYILSPAEGRFPNPIGDFNLYYFNSVIRDFLFLIPITLICIPFALKKEFKHAKTMASFLLVSFVYILSLNFAKDKSDWYNLPAYPLLAISIGLIANQLFKKTKVLFTVLFVATIVLQTTNAYRIENIYPDRSHIGADLGKYASFKIPKEDTIILDDQDFTSFLYYSGHSQVYTLENDKESNQKEWWKVSTDQLPEFLNKNKNVWILTSNKNKFEGLEQISETNGYYFLKN